MQRILSSSEPFTKRDNESMFRLINSMPAFFNVFVVFFPPLKISPRPPCPTGFGQAGHGRKVGWQV